MEESQESKTSKYNSGIAQLYRLDGLWKDVNNHSRNGQFTKWNEDLDRVWCELARDLDEKTKKEKEKEESNKKKIYYEDEKNEFDVFDTELKDTGAFHDKEPEGFIKVPEDMKKKRNEQYKILMNKELYLRRLENRLGKGTAWGDEDEDNWD
jgi:hypothetical protein